MSAKAFSFDQRRLLLGHRAVRPGNSPKLRVGVVTGTPEGPAWARLVVQLLQSLPELEVSYCPRNAEGSRFGPDASWLAARLYERSQRQFDPFGPVKWDGAPVANLNTDFDLAIQLAPDADDSVAARFGTLSVQLGDRDVEPPYWGEVIANDPISKVNLRWRESAAAPDRLLRTAELGTRRGLGFTANADGCLQAAVQLLVETALDIAQDGAGWVERAQSMPVAPKTNARRYPSTVRCAGYLAGELKRRFANRNASPRSSGWFCALRRDPSLFYGTLGRFDDAGWEDIPLVAGAQIADPFLVHDNGRNWLFVEEIRPGQRKGFLSCMEIPAAGQPIPKAEIVMETDTHLSYPCVFRHNGDYFMIPETSATQEVRLYRARRFPLEWELECVLLEKIPVTDTTPYFHDGHWYFFTTTMTPYRQTVLLTAAKLGGPLTLHRDSPVSCSVVNTRAAGHLFRSGGRLLRPSQDCLVRYGFGMTMNEISRLTPTEYLERPVDHIGPSWQSGLLGTHTLNAIAGLEVVDGCRYFA